mmetsp:Transcript_120080/g.340450  ORF Transcript_120080/g.340450 Transcript_120080/m.340450 type:complete len:306 (+) Transcript_120080:1291-2208(+)
MSSGMKQVPKPMIGSSTSPGRCSKDSTFCRTRNTDFTALWFDKGTSVARGTAWSFWFAVMTRSAETDTSRLVAMWSARNPRSEVAPTFASLYAIVQCRSLSTANGASMYSVKRCSRSSLERRFAVFASSRALPEFVIADSKYLCSGPPGVSDGGACRSATSIPRSLSEALPSKSSRILWSCRCLSWASWRTKNWSSKPPPEICVLSTMMNGPSAEDLGRSRAQTTDRTARGPETPASPPESIRSEDTCSTPVSTTSHSVPWARMYSSFTESFSRGLAGTAATAPGWPYSISRTGCAFTAEEISFV